MRLSGLTLETEYFEDYLSFLTEVLELNLKELTDTSMRLDLDQTWLEIKSVAKIPQPLTNHVEFSLSEKDFDELVQRVSFFYYRRGPSRFLFLGSSEQWCGVVDPDGRVWRFVNEVLTQSSLTNFTQL
jgi:hypothetical protein